MSETGWENARFEDITPKNVDEHSMTFHVRKPVKGKPIPKVREISYKTLKRFGLGHLISELDTESKGQSGT